MEINRTALASLGIALLAIVLSQLRPLYTYFDTAEFSMTIHQSLQVRHYLGEIFIVPYVRIKNSGGAGGYISRIELRLTRKDNPSYTQELTAQSYYLKPETVGMNQAPTQIPFGDISVGPGESWDFYVEFFQTPTSEKRIQFAELKSRVQSEIQRELDALPPDAQKLVEISDSLFEELGSISTSGLKSFEIGEYSVEFGVIADGGRNPVNRMCYTLTIFEGHIERLQAIIEGYRIGAGLIIPPIGKVGFTTNLFESECPT